MADITNPFGDKKPLSVELLPNFYKTDPNKRFLQATVDQLIQPGVVKKINGFIGRQDSKATVGTDIFLKAVTPDRQTYQLEPSITVNDTLGNNLFFKDYIDYVNQLTVLGANTSNHTRINKEEFYSWDPHIDWDKFVNFQNYYWLPYGPETIRIYGQQATAISTFNIDLQVEGSNNQLVFTPDGLTPNPVIKLYRGQTYTFNITSLGNPISIRLVRSLQSLDKYNKGVSQQSVDSGTIIFKVPLDAPNILYYQSDRELNLGGAFEILSIDQDSYIDVASEILGKATYTLSNGTALSNGMKVTFAGNVSPAKYATGEYYVEGVGSSIVLINKQVLEVSSVYTVQQTILFDATPFDSTAFSDTTSFAQLKDYVTINRASNDHNPWSRYNRWFHKDVISSSALFNGHYPDTDQLQRAIRPIIEFQANLKLFNFGTSAIADIDLIDNFTTDAFSTIEGSKGYSVDSVALSQGQKILFTADTDKFVKNNIYQVEFVDVEHLNSGSRQIHLTKIAEPTVNQVVLIRNGTANEGLMYWYNGTAWIKTQTKTKVNQPPLFDVVDANGVSFGNLTTYEGSTFAGTKIFSYKVASSGAVDPYLNFPLTYKNIANIGDIVFNFNLILDSFIYKNITTVINKDISTGFLSYTTYAGNTEHINGWQKCNTTTVQAGVRIYKNSNITNNFNIDIFDNIENLADLQVKVFINGIFLNSNFYSIADAGEYKKIILKTPVELTDVLTIKTYSNQPINSKGHYEIPLNLQNNPLNDVIENFTLGEVIDHFSSIISNIPAKVLTAVAENADPHTTVNTISNQTFDPDYFNIRDLGNVTQYGTKFVQHSAPASLNLYHITSQPNNAVKAIEQSRDDYIKFKKLFVSVAANISNNNIPRKQVDEILKIINADKINSQPYYFSDMTPYGSSVSTTIEVIDYRIQNYPLNNVFNLDTLSANAVGVYVNDVQLIYGQDYTFSSQGFVTITSLLANGDLVSIYEYDSTDGCFIPETPTKLGIFPKFAPKIYLDTTLITPRIMIQGHDGSQILAYNDYRDDIILELEKRIFNNIKISYDAALFDINDVIPSYTNKTEYSLTEYNQVLSPSFYKWVSLIDQDYTKNTSFAPGNPFTYNYIGTASPSGTDVPGYWRGIFRYFYNTDRPNLCPWEMLGFTLEPSWWTTAYGPSPYTSDNLVMWSDISKGLVKGDGTSPPVINSKYVKAFLLNNIPVDESGNLISPAAAGLTIGALTTSIEANFKFGDVGPVESAWRRSSHYPFSILLANMLLFPAHTFSVLLDRSRIVRNASNQIIYSPTGLVIKPSDIVLPSIASSNDRVQTSGIINYIINYILSDNLKSYTAYKYDLTNIQTRLSHRVGGFTSKQKFNLILDSKTPLSTNSVFVPQEDYTVILNKSSPIKKICYSGVVITKLAGGFEVRGYTTTQPYFVYYPYLQSGTTVTIGGISEAYTVWTPNENYVAGKVVRHVNQYYRVKTAHISADTIQTQYFASLGSLPIIGGKSAVFRKTWDRTTKITVPYGTQFDTIQEVVDFLLGYGEYLKDQGFIFDDFNANLQIVTNWETSAKEFLFWTTQNWSSGQDKWEDWVPNRGFVSNDIVRYNGAYYKAIQNVAPSTVFQLSAFLKLDGLSTSGSSVLSLSPAADKIIFNTELSVVDDIRNQFNGYEIYKVDGTPLEAIFINSYRSDNAVSYSPRTGDGIYGATFYLIQHEHVVLLNNNTMFNDTLYNPPTGYKQDRIKVSGYISTDWYGGFDIPGFILDLAKITEWQTWTDYDLGDIVKHKEFYYTASKFLAGSVKFVDNDWIKLDEKPTTQLLPNWTYKAGQFTDFYSLDSENFDSGQQRVAQHLIGYQKRQYLDNIIQDEVSEYKFYQGMIREKGTQNVLNKLFDVLSADNKESLTFYEEWAVRVGQYGANNAFENIEFTLDRTTFTNNPQGFELVNVVEYDVVKDFIIRQTPNDIYLKPLGYNSSPWPLNKNYQTFLNSSGYVRSSEVFKSLKTLGDITGIDPVTGINYDITTFDNNCYVHVAFDTSSWNVYKFTDLNIAVTSVSYANSTLTITTRDLVNLSVGEYIGISQVNILTGFYQITSIELNSFTLLAKINGFPSPFTQSSQMVIYGFVSQRVPRLDDLDAVVTAQPTPGDKAWVDDNGFGKWSTLEYSPVYKSTEIANTFPADNLTFGKKLIINKAGNIAVTAMSTGEIRVWDKAGQSSSWVERQSISLPVELVGTNTANNLSTVLAISDDAKWLAVGSPLAGNLPTQYAGELSVVRYYQVKEVVSFTNLYGVAEFYESLSLHYGGFNVITQLPDPTKWKKIPYLTLDVNGQPSYVAEEGVVSLYQKDANNIFTLVDHIVSPTPRRDSRNLTANEHFGSSIAFADGVMWIAAPGYKTLSSSSSVHLTPAPYITTGIVRKYKYDTVVNASSPYNPVGSTGTTLAVTSTIGILPDMDLIGIGFTNQYVVSILSPTLVQISVAPTSTPSGIISFTNTYWHLDNTFVGHAGPLGDLVFIETITRTGTTATAHWSDTGIELFTVGSQITISGTPFATFNGTFTVTASDLYNITFTVTTISDTVDGTVYNALNQTYQYVWSGVVQPTNIYASRLRVSADNSILVVSGTIKGTTGVVYVYADPANIVVQTIVGTDYFFGVSVDLTSSGNYLAIGDITSIISKINQGSVIIYKFTGDTAGHSFEVYQTLVNHSFKSSGYFGTNLGFMNGEDTLVVYSQDEDTSQFTKFDSYKSALYNDSNIPVLTTDKISLGKTYRITSLGNFPQEQWNTLANTVNEEYIVGSYFTALREIEPGIITDDYNAANPTSTTTTDKIDVGVMYRIISLGTVTQTQWNALANTIDLIYEVGSLVYSHQVTPAIGTVTLASNIYVTDASSTVTTPTTFDKKSTVFTATHTNSGRIDVYDRYLTKWVYSETLETSSEESDGYGLGFAVGANHILVGAPYSLDSIFKSGKIYDYYKNLNSLSWNVLHYEIDKPDPKKIKKAFLYNKLSGTLIKYLDVVDVSQGKIAGLADEEIKFKTFYDPAIYSVSTGEYAVVLDSQQSWAKSRVGMLWWNLSTAKFIDCYDNDVVYRNTNWNTLATGASIDIYEWVESTVLPSVWDTRADTTAGLAANISGTSLYKDAVYSKVTRFDTIAQTNKYTYYFWVKNKKIIPNVSGRYLSASDVSMLIANPRGYNYAYLALTGANSFSLVNVANDLIDKNVVLSVEYWTIDKLDQNIHSQYKLISNDPTTIMPTTIEQKWIDSLCGNDLFGRTVPDTALQPKLKYGIQNRPRQSMFVNRFEALKELVDRTNTILIRNQISENRNISNLKSYDKQPSTNTGLYDLVKTTEIEIPLINIGAFNKPVLGAPTISNGRVIDVPIISAGRGYLFAPYITITGAGNGAKVQSVINAAGQITGVVVINSGEGYTANTKASIRNFSVLIESDGEAEGFWSIYSYDTSLKIWSRIQTQSYDVRNFWEYSDWYAIGFNKFSPIDYSVDNYYGLNTISTELTQLVKIRNTNSGGWSLLEKYNNSASSDWTQSYRVVGLQSGTIQLKSSLYQSINTTLGYDGSIYDNVVYDNSPNIELRVILETLKNNILIGDLKQDYLNLFFTTIRYALSEQLYLDWIFKTSFIKSTHNVGLLDQPVTYRPDNLSNFQDYISEVVPYRTTIREYVSSHSATDQGNTLISDFDLPPIFENNSNTVINAYVKDGSMIVDDANIQVYPWKNWLENVGFTIISINIVDGGSGYISEPVVSITSNSGSGATARAFFANGIVNRIVLLTPGTGYLSAPTVTISGGLSITGIAAKAAATIGKGVVRSNLIKIKFDRTTYAYYVTQLSVTQTFAGRSGIVQFQLKWAPDIKIGNSSVTVDGVVVLRDLYKLTIVSSKVNKTTQYSGLITFLTPPANGAVVIVNYNKDESLLNSADRIQYYYQSSKTTLGSDLAQLMTGIDYGGVIVDGMSFDVATGWGTLPYFSDKWDSADPTFNDYIVTVTANTHSFTLPYTPSTGIQLNIYYIQKNVDVGISDGVNLTYPFSLFNTTVVPSAEYDATSVTIETAYVPPVGTYTASTTLKVASTAGIQPGMTVFGTGFVINSQTQAPLQKVISVNSVNNTVLLTSPPNVRPVGILSFTFNIPGTFELHLANVEGVIVGDIVSTSVLSCFGNDTVVVSVDNNTNKVMLNQIVYRTIPYNTIVTFSRSINVIFYNYNAILPAPAAIGTRIIITGTLDAIRLDDPYYGIDPDPLHPDAPYQTNPTAICVSPIGNNTTNTFTIPNTFDVYDGDQFIIRQSTSDGSVKPLEQDYDTALSGGNIAYSTATGISPDEIIVDGDDLISPTTSPAPEEVVPGQIVDALAIKVYDQPNSGSANIKVDKYFADGIVKTFEITQTFNNARAIIVKNNNVISSYTTDYTVDYKNKLVNFNFAPNAGNIISIFSFGFNGSNIIDIDSFVGDGSTTEFLTKAPWLTYETGLVYVNGVAASVELFKTDSTYDSANRTGIRFGVAPTVDSVINYVIVSGTQQTFSIAKTETIVADGVKNTYGLSYPVGNTLPAETNMIVRVDNTILPNPVNQYFTIENDNLSYTIDKARALPYSIIISNILVYVAGKKLNLGTDYVIDLGGITVNITKQNYNIYKGQVLAISTIQTNGYTYLPATQQIVFNTIYTPSNTIEVMSFYNHDILDIERTAFNITTNISYTQDTVAYFNYTGLGAGILPVDRIVLNDAYVWVMKNNVLLTPSVDYKLSDNKKSVILKITPERNDVYSLMTFNNNILVPGISYMQFKDMLNRTHFKRLSKNKQTKLATDLRYNDIAIQLIDASNFDLPNPALNKPGVVEIYGERIEFYQIEENTLSQLRRGTQGTGTPRIHPIGTPVQDIGPGETLPYSESSLVTTVISDGTNIVPLPFVPEKADTVWTYGAGFTSTIPSGYGQSDQLEIFIAGYNDAIDWYANTSYTVGVIIKVASYTYRCVANHTSSTNFLDDKANWQFFVGNLRLKKQPYKVHNETISPYSPAGDVQLDAEFAVDGVSSSLRLTNLIPAGTQVTVVRRKGTRWDSSLNIQYDDNAIANFLKATPGIWYHDKVVLTTSTTFTGTFDNSSTGFDNSTDTW
jgi:hypothetical protein